MPLHGLALAKGLRHLPRSFYICLVLRTLLAAILVVAFLQRYQGNGTGQRYVPNSNNFSST